MGLVYESGWSLPEFNSTDAERFRRAGYSTYLVGHQHERISTADLGFEHVVESQDLFEIARIAERLFLEIGNEQSGDSRRPFYMRLTTFATHRDWQPEGRPAAVPFDPELVHATDYGYDWAYRDGIPEERVDVFPGWLGTPALRKDLAGFSGDVKRLDAAIGLILAGLRRAGLNESRIVVFVSDHGIDFPRGKATLYDLGIKTALIMRVPGRQGVVTSLTSHVDALPTLLDVCRIGDDRDEIQGASLLV